MPEVFLSYQALPGLLFIPSLLQLLELCYRFAFHEFPYK